MYVDFQLDRSGDLLFIQQDKQNSSIKLSFTLSQTNATKISFDLSNFKKIEPSENALKISLDIEKNIANKAVSIINEDEAKKQLLILKLNTTLGELPLRKDFGSKISLMKHKEINPTNLSALESYVAESISDIIPNPIVNASPYISYDNGYNQTVIISIYSKNKRLLNYIIER